MSTHILETADGTPAIVRGVPLQSERIDMRIDRTTTPRFESNEAIRQIIDDHLYLIAELKKHYLFEAMPFSIRGVILNSDLWLEKVRGLGLAQLGAMIDQTTD